jgi:hypothetical protein
MAVFPRLFEHTLAQDQGWKVDQHANRSAWPVIDDTHLGEMLQKQP